MNAFFDFSKQLILATAIAITIPCMIYWGIQAIVQTNHVYTSEQPIDHTDQNNQKQEIGKGPMRKIQFWTFTVSALLCIGLGAFIQLPSISLGLMGAGFLNLIMGMANALQHPLYNFVVLITLLISMVVIAMKSSLIRSTQ